MGAITPTAVLDTDRAATLEALRHLRLSFTASNAETYVFGTSPKIVKIAWEPADANPCFVTETAGTILFTNSGGAATGYLHLWTTG